MLVRMMVGSLITALFAASMFAAEPAQAKDVICDELGNCKTYCHQNLPNGDRVLYEEGTEITIITADGEEHKFVCKNGQWERASIIVPGKFQHIGAIGVGSIAGVQGELSTEVCNDSPEPVCEVITNSVMPPGQVAASP